MYGFFALSKEYDISTIERGTSQEELVRKLLLKDKIIDEALDAYDIVDEKGLFTYANKAYVKMWGYKDKEEIIGTSPSTHCVDPELPLKIITTVEKEGSGIFEFKARRKDNSVFDVLMKITCYVDENGKKYYHGFSQDITHKKEQENELEKHRKNLEELVKEKNHKLVESEEKFRNIFNLSQSMICIANINTTTFEVVNPAFTEVLGYKEDELLGRSFLDFIHPDDKDPTIRVIEEKLKSGEKVLKFINRYRCKDNTYIWLDWNSHPVPEKGITYAVANDISERKRAERELLIQQDFLKKSQEIGNIGTWHLDMERNILTWTDENYKIFGVEPKTPMTYELFMECVHPEDREYVDSEWKKGIKNRSYDIEHRLLVEGKEKWVREKAEFISDSQGRIQEAIGVTQDITNKKKVELSLQKQIIEKEILMKEVHHRVKNNIANIEGLLFLQSSSAKNSDVTAALNEATSRVGSIRILYDKLLLDEEYKMVSMASYLDNFIESLIEVFTLKNNISIKKHITDFKVNSKYAVNIGIIINELITNTIKYAFKDRNTGKIIISLNKNDSRITLVVKDNGIGIQKKILEEEKSGFGINLVKMLVEQLDGTLNIENIDGTQFTIEFEI